MGASPIANCETCCGVPSSMTRKLPLGIPGMKRPRLSSTATSTETVVESLLKVVMPSGNASGPFFLSFDSIGARSGSGASPAFFRGRATVSEPSFLGPGCDQAGVRRASNTDIDRKKRRRIFNYSLAGEHTTTLDGAAPRWGFAAMADRRPRAAAPPLSPKTGSLAASNRALARPSVDSRRTPASGAHSPSGSRGGECHAARRCS